MAIQLGACGLRINPGKVNRSIDSKVSPLIVPVGRCKTVVPAN